MGSYASIKIGNYDFLSWKNSFGNLLMIFSTFDRRIVDSIDDGETYKSYQYATTIKKAKLCLDVLGFNIKSTKCCFEEGKANKLEFLKELLEKGIGQSEKDIGQYEIDFTYESWSEAAKKYAKVLSTDSFIDVKYVELEKHRDNFSNLSLAEQEVIKNLPFSDPYFGFPFDSSHESTTSEWHVFRVLLEAFSDNDEVILDYTDLLLGGWCDEFPMEDDFCINKIIILTEGRYDAKVIGESMELLYPFMRKFYSFIDFQLFKVDAGVSFMAKYFRMFAAAGLQNRVIALFDNDTAGNAEIKSLQTLSFPDNFRILSLPHNTDANSWNTLGHTKDEMFNINGVACSIELYLGMDVLLDEDGKQYPVRWRGYDEKSHKYQGEILYKDAIQKAFDNKLKKAKESGVPDLSKWIQLDNILNMIFRAFD